MMPCRDVVGYHFLKSFRLKMNVTRCSEALVSYHKMTWRHNPEDLDFTLIFIVVKTSNLASRSNYFYAYKYRMKIKFVVI
jgi:hypothetical protein